MSIYHIPYTYVIGWSKLNKYYYGRRTANNCNPNDFWIKYFTSSKDVKEFRKIHGEPDIIKIRRTFNNIIECSKWEVKVLRRLKVSKNDLWLNKSYGTIGIGGKPKGSKEKSSTKLKKSISAKGKLSIREITTNNVIRLNREEALLLIHTGNYKHIMEGLQKPRTLKQNSHHSKTMKGKPAHNKGKPPPRCTCIICHKEVDVYNFRRWHLH